MRLPNVQARPRQAERPSLATVRPTDLGLGAVAQDVAAWEAEVEQTRAIEQQAQRVEDEKAVEPTLRALQEQFEPTFAEQGANYDGVTPGFARGVTATLDAAADPLTNRPDLTPGQRDALTRGISQYKEATAQRAISFQSQRRGALAAEQVSAREATAVGAVMSSYTEAFAERRATLDQAYDGTTPGYAGQVLAAHDETAAAAIESAPEALRARLTQSFATRRLQLQGQAMDVEAQAEQGVIANTVKTSGSQMINGVLTAPSLYETAVGDIDQVVAGLSARERPAARAGLLSELTEAYVTGLLRDGQQDAALAQLNGGALDGRLTPDAKARLLDRAVRKTEELSVDDWMGRLRMSSAIDDDIASRAATGVGTGISANDVAGSLGAREAAQYQLQVEAAEASHASLAGLAQMTPSQIREQLAAQAPTPGQPGYAEAQQRYVIASRAAEAEIKAREDDPAAWALRNAPSLAGGLSALSNADPAAARVAAGAYGVGQLALQTTAGIPAAERRLLPKATASALVEAAASNGDPRAGLIGLGQVIESFGPPPAASGQTITAAMARQRMVVAELKAAGADNGDLAAAVDLAGDPVRLGRYIAADTHNALAVMDRSDRGDLEDAVGAAMRPYLRSFDGVAASRELTNGRVVMAQRLAAERIARRGGSVREAAAEAAEIVGGQYEFVGSQGWRMPTAVANRREPGGGAVFGRTLAQRGASRIVSTLATGDGAGFYTPADNGRGLSAAQRRERYADTVTTNGRWMTTPDDAGLVLMHPNLDGGWTPALDSGGRPVARSWAALTDAGRDRRTAAGSTAGGRAPRGLRNNNPGNIEVRPEYRWQGQTGSDGRFVTFETPEHGLRALSRDMGTKMSKGLTTIASILTVYAPPRENNTAAYIAAVSRSLGIAPNAQLDPNDVRIRAGLMAAIVQHENGQQPYSAELIQQGARMGMR